jgi:hypothetical protein
MMTPMKKYMLVFLFSSIVYELLLLLTIVNSIVTVVSMIPSSDHSVASCAALILEILLNRFIIKSTRNRFIDNKIVGISRPHPRG